jgi:PKD repeat protein
MKNPLHLFFYLLVYFLLLSGYLKAQNLVTYAGDGRTERFNSVMELSDGTYVVAGTASTLNWLVGSPPITQLNSLNIDNAGVSGRDVNIGFLLHISADLQQILRVVRFPTGAVIDIMHIKSTSAPGAVTGDLYISGTTASGYFIARLNNNFVNGVPTALRWAVNVRASGDHRTRQPWDVGGDGKVVYASGTPDGDDFAAVFRLRDDGLLDIVPNWRYHFGVRTNTGTPAEGSWTPAFSNPQVNPRYSAVVFKADTRCSLRSWAPADYTAVLPDGNGNTKQGRWPMDVFYAGPCDIQRPQSTMQQGGYTGYRLGSKTTHRIGGIAVDRRNNHMYIGASINSVTREGRPDFEPFVIAYTESGDLKWWSRLYQETPEQSPPDQFVDALGIDYASTGNLSSLLVMARQHGNAPRAFWAGNDVRNNPLHPPGTNTFHSRFTGNVGNIQVSWLGKLRLTNGDLLYSTYIAGFQGSGALGAPYAEPILDGWPNHNLGNADLNTARSGINLLADPAGNVYTLINARAFVTTSNAYQKHQKPANGPSVWASNVRIYTPDLRSLVYSSALTGVNPETGTGGNNTQMMAAYPVRNGVILVGYQEATSTGQARGTNIPVANVPPWGGPAPQSESAILARLTFSDLKAIFTLNPPFGTCTGEEVAVTDSSFSVGSNIVDWAWNFGEDATPATATGRGPHRVVWNTPGEKTVQLTVRDNQGNTDTETKTYLISERPVATIATDPVSGNIDPAPQNVRLFTNEPVNPQFTYRWEVDDPVRGTVTYAQPTANHLFQISGDFQVRLEVNNGLCSVFDTLVVTVTGGPGIVDPLFRVTPDQACVGAPVLFEQVSDSNVVAWSWFFGEGAIPATANTAGPHAVVYTTPGVKRASLTVSNGVIELTHTEEFRVAEGVNASFSITGNTNQLPASITFTPFLPDQGFQYQWNFGNPADDSGDNESTEQIPTYNYPFGGNYVVSLRITTPEGCTTIAFDSLTINAGIDTVAADFEIIASRHTCVFNTVTLTDMSRGYRSNERIWFFDDDDFIFPDSVELRSPISSPGPVNVYWTTPGLKRITLQVVGESAEDTKIASLLYRVFPYPNPNFSIRGETCEAPATLTFTPIFGSGLYYEWDFGDGSQTVASSIATHTYTSPGTYTVTLRVRNEAGCLSVLARNITIGTCPQPPTAGIIARPAREDCGEQRYIFESAALGTFTNWEWDFGLGTPASASGPGPHEVFFDRGGGPFTVRLTVTDEAGNTYTVSAEIP